MTPSRILEQRIDIIRQAHIHQDALADAVYAILSRDHSMDQACDIYCPVGVPVGFFRVEIIKLLDAYAASGVKLAYIK